MCIAVLCLVRILELTLVLLNRFFVEMLLVLAFLSFFQVTVLFIDFFPQHFPAKSEFHTGARRNPKIVHALRHSYKWHLRNVHIADLQQLVAFFNAIFAHFTRDRFNAQRVSYALYNVCTIRFLLHHNAHAHTRPTFNDNRLVVSHSHGAGLFHVIQLCHNVIERLLKLLKLLRFPTCTVLQRKLAKRTVDRGRFVFIFRIQS
mmetsp:Transcript_49614/g.86687  ORF Transcript_49614/g.86687 Transcript_49614/m.86687 type:complete len:203 (-) Transcript_49614:342-950(-)